MSVNLSYSLCDMYILVFQHLLPKMPQTYNRTQGARKYGYSADSTQQAVVDMKENSISIRKAAFLHNVNRTTLLNHLKEYRSGPIG